MKADNLFEIAQKIDNFFYEYDTYDYSDSIEDREENVNRIHEHLATNNYSHYIDELKQIIIEESGTEEEQQEAKELVEILNAL